jgi:hypothetical protein
MRNSSARIFASLLFRVSCIALPVAAFGVAQVCAAQSKPAAANPSPDVLVLSNGDTLHGKFVSETAGTVTFHSDPLGDITLAWSKIKELHVTGMFGILSQTVGAHGKHHHVHFPVGAFEVANEALTVHTESAPPLAPIPVAKARYIMESSVLDKQINHEPGFFAGWNGTATAGATLVSATQNQYTFTGAVDLVRAVPTVNWLEPRNKTIFGFNESYGKITQPAYSYSATPPATGLIQAPAIVTKSSIMHVGAERDEFFSPRFYVLGMTTGAVLLTVLTRPNHIDAAMARRHADSGDGFPVFHVATLRLRHGRDCAERHQPSNLAESHLHLL